MNDDTIRELPGADLSQPDKPSAKVLPFGGVTCLDMDPDLILENNKGCFAGFVIAGWDHDGEFIAASSYADGGTVLWLIELLKRRLMEG